MNGTRDILSVAGETVVKPVVSGVVTLVCVAAGVIGVFLLVVVVLVHKHGPPKVETVKAVYSLFKK